MLKRRELNALLLASTGLALSRSVPSFAGNDIASFYDNADAMAMAAAVNRGELSAQELLNEAITRAERINPLINALTNKLYDRARQQIKAGLPNGPLRGVPFLLKDLGATLAGTITTHGSRLHANNVARNSSTLVQRQLRAGVVIFGKTNTPEYGMALTTENLFTGDSLNPWNVAHSSGGSSGGSAAAVAAGILPMAHGTDGGGSIRVPASHCGIFGFKPTRGLTPGANGAGMSVGHVLSRSVRDSATMLDATAGYEAGAPYGAGLAHTGHFAATQRDPKSLRVALNLSNPAVRIDPECRAAVQQTARLLETLGHVVESAAPAIDFARLNDAQNTLMTTGLTNSLKQIERAQQRAVQVPDIEPMTAMIRRFGEMHNATDYVVALQQLHDIGRTMGSFMADYDVILQAVTATPAPRLKTITFREGDSLLDYTRRFKQVSAFTHLYNMSGQPSMSLPLAQSGDGLPIGVMLSGRVGEDRLLLSLAAQLERATPWHQRRPRMFNSH